MFPEVYRCVGRLSAAIHHGSCSQGQDVICTGTYHGERPPSAQRTEHSPYRALVVPSVLRAEVPRVLDPYVRERAVNDRCDMKSVLAGV